MQVSPIAAAPDPAGGPSRITAPENATDKNAATTDAALRVAAQKLEASFLAEMLKAAGLGKSRGQFGGGTGEDQFSSFLVQEQAMAMVQAGGIGLSETLFEALKERDT